MTGKRELPKEGEDWEKTEMEDSEVLDMESTKQQSKDSHSQTPPPYPSNNPLTAHTPKDRPYPKLLSTSPSPSQPSLSQPKPFLHLPPANKVNSQNTTSLKNKQLEPEPDHDPTSSAEAHGNHSFMEEHKDEDVGEDDSISSSPRLVRGVGVGK